MQTGHEILARTEWGEARSEGRTGMEAVASVALTRARIAGEWEHKHGKHHPGFGPGNIVGVCLWPLQFSCWNDRDENRKALLTVDATDQEYQIALDIAHAALSGDLVDATRGATHYLRADIAAGSLPSWAVHGTWLCQIGRHAFYRAA